MKSRRVILTLLLALLFTVNVYATSEQEELIVIENLQLYEAYPRPNYSPERYTEPDDALRVIVENQAVQIEAMTDLIESLNNAVITLNNDINIQYAQKYAEMMFDRQLSYVLIGVIAAIGVIYIIFKVLNYFII